MKLKKNFIHNKERIIQMNNETNRHANAKLILLFFEHCKEAKGYSERTCIDYENAVLEYEKFDNYNNLANFIKDKAIAYKNQLRNNNYSISSINKKLNALKIFYTFAHLQPSYKTKININDIQYLNLTRAEKAMLNSHKTRDFGTHQQLCIAINNIKINTEVDLRDKVILIILYCTGIRVGALISLPIKCLDIFEWNIYQYPKEGVNTKFTKTIDSYFFNFNQEWRDTVKEYVNLLKEKGFGYNDPLFPSTKLEHKRGTYCYVGENLDKKFWESTSSLSKIVKKRFAEAGLPAFSPHSIRHSFVVELLNRCSTGIQIKAVSQHLGHEHLETTLGCYGTLDKQHLFDILKNIDCTKDKEN